MLTVEKLGYVAGKRVYRYRLGAEVLQVDLQQRLQTRGSWIGSSLIARQHSIKLT